MDIFFELFLSLWITLYQINKEITNLIYFNVAILIFICHVVNIIESIFINFALGNETLNESVCLICIHEAIHIIVKSIPVNINNMKACFSNPIMVFSLTTPC